MNKPTKDSNYKLIKKLVTNIHFPPKTIAILLLGVIISSIITFIRPQIVSSLTDNGLIKKNFNVIVFWCIILLTCALVEYANEFLQIKVFVKLSNQFSEKLYQSALDRILKAPYACSQNRSSAELLNTINNDVSRISLLLDRSSLIIIQFLFQIVGGTVGLLLLNWRVAIVLLLVIPMKQVIVHQLSKRKTVLTERYIEEIQKFSEWFGNQTSGIIEIKLWNLYSRKRKEFVKHYQSIPELNTKLQMCDGVENILGTATGVLIEILIYLFCGYLLCKGSMSMGNLLAFISYAMYVANPLGVLTNIPYIWAQIKPSAKRFAGVLEWPEENLISDNQTSMSNYDIELKKVNFRYDPDSMILNNVNLKIPQGSKIAIIGENGTGKTTLINLLLGIIVPNEGDINIGGNNINKVGLNKWRDCFAVVGQKPYLFQGTIMDNVDLNNVKTVDEIEKVVEEIGLDITIHQHENSYDYKIQDNGINLSGGEKQKLSFLRAFLKNAEIIILDEAFSNCDEESRKIIRNIVFDRDFKKTIILISHYQEDLQGIQKLYEIKDGTLQEKNVRI